MTLHKLRDNIILLFIIVIQNIRFSPSFFGEKFK